MYNLVVLYLCHWPFNVCDAVGGEGPDPAPHEEPEDQQRSGRSQVSYPFLHTYRESSRFSFEY